MPWQHCKLIKMAGKQTTKCISEESHNNLERWICVYPAYINSRKTLCEGRKIPKDKTVDNPTVQEIRDVLTAAGLKVTVENKMYSRERSKEAMCRGRVRVQLRDADGTGSTSFPTRESVMLHAAATIPHLKSRSGKQRGSEPQPAARPTNVGSKKKGKTRK